MKIACPSCKAEYNIEDARVPASGLTMRCPRCTTSFSVKKDGTVSSAAPPPGPPPGVRLPPATPPGAPPPGPPPGARVAPPPGPPPGARAAPPPGPPPGARAGAVPLPSARPGAAPPLPDLPPPPPPPPGGDFPSLDASLFDAAPAPSPTDPAAFDFAGLELEGGGHPAAAAEPPPPPPARDPAVLDPPRPAAPVTPPPEAPALGAHVAPMGATVDEGDLELLDFIDAAAPTGAAAAALPDGRFHVRRKTGKIFGPFEAALVIKMLAEGQLLGNEDVSTDTESWKPIGSVPAFAGAIQRLMDSPGALSKPRPDAPAGFGGRMAEISVVGGEELEAKAPSLLDRLRTHRKAAMGAAAGLGFLLAGGGLELFSPWGFWFRKPIVALVTGGSRGGAQIATLLAESEQGMRADSYKAMSDALAAAQKAFELDRKSDATRAQLAFVALTLEKRFGGYAVQVTQVRPLLQDLAQDAADDPAVIRAVAAGYLLDGKLDLARKALQEHMQKDPKDQDALFLLVRAQLATETPEDARAAGQHIQRLLQIDPRSARALHARGRVLKIAGDEKAATEAFEAALAADPRHTSSAVEAAGIALESRKDLADAERLLGLALSPEGSQGLGPQEMATALAYQAQARNLHGQPVEAEPLFQQALQRDPKNITAQAYYGHFLLEQNQVDRAIEMLQPVREARPGNVAVAMDLALGQARRGKLLEAMKIVEELQKKSPSDARVTYLQGLVFLENGKTDDGIRALRTAADQDSEYAEPLVKLARTYLDAGNLEEARKALEAAAARAPEYPDVLSAQGFFHLANGEPEIALGYFDKAVSSQPGFASAHHGRALVLEKKGELDAAREAYKLALVTGFTRPRIRLDYGTFLFHAGDLPAALAELEAAKKLDPKNARIRSRLGAVEYHAKKIEESIVDIQSALSLDSKNPETFLYLALLSKEKGDLPRAVEAGRTAVQLDPKDPHLAYELGQVYEASSNPVEALDWYQKAAALDPKHADALEHAARMQTTLNATQAAIKSYEAAIAADPTRKRLLLAVGDAYLRARDWRRAIAKLTEAIQADPSLVGAYFKLGQAYEESGKRGDAIKNFELAVEKEPENALAYRYLAYSLKEKGRYREAVGWFRKYLEKSPEAEDKAEIEDEISALAP